MASEQHTLTHAAPHAPAHQPAQADPPLMTLAEAASITGRSIVAVRAALRRDLTRPDCDRHLKPRKGNDGQWRIAVPAAWLEQAGTPAGRHDSHIPIPEATHASAQTERLVEMHERLATVERERAEARERLAEMRVALAEIRVALARTEAEVTTAKAVAAAEVEAVRQATADQIAARNAVIETLTTARDDLAARLDRAEAELRRSWWSRFFARR